MKRNAETGLCGDFAAVKRAWAHGRLGIADRAVAGGTSPAGTQACVLGLILERVDRRTMAILPGCVPRMEDLSAGYYSDKTTMLALRALEETRLVQVQRHGKVVIGIAIVPPSELAPPRRRPPRVSKEMRAAVFSRDQGACRYCRASERLTIDHVIPQRRNGENTLDNLVVACRRCNHRKRCRTPEQAGMTLLEVPR